MLKKGYIVIREQTLPPNSTAMSIMMGSEVYLYKEDAENACNWYNIVLNDLYGESYLYKVENILIVDKDDHTLLDIHRIPSKFFEKND